LFRRSLVDQGRWMLRLTVLVAGLTLTNAVLVLVDVLNH
jgi:hypothetical protein